ncbi:Cysteine-rich secretory protein family protein [Verrucomicrobium sp. GAS474]|nr:Cysteine-rich secretory protein family protein [Verrucomicrobium sp. GAS474]
MAAVFGLAAAWLAAPLPAAAKGNDDEVFQQEAVRQINGFRASEKRGPVTLDPALNALASEWAAKLAHEGEMEHRSMGNMRTLLSSHGWSALNENLFMSSAPSASPSEVIAAWKESTGHRRNLLQGNITRIGIGTAAGKAGFFVVFNGAGG